MRRESMKPGTMLRTAAALAAAACAAGCGGGYRDDWITVAPGSRQGDVSVYRDVQFADIPVPAEMLLLPRESYSFQGSLFRQAQIKYEGPLGMSEVIRFYEMHLPQAGWRFEKSERGYDLRVLYFSKGQEQLIVVARSVPNGARAEIQLDNVDKNDLLLKGKLTEPRYAR